MMRAASPSGDQRTAWMTVTPITYAPHTASGMAHGAAAASGIVTLASPPLGKVLVKEGDECALFGRMRSVGAKRSSVRRVVGDCDAVIDVAFHNDRVHVTFAADRRRVAELRGHQTHYGVDVALRLCHGLRRT